MYFNTKKEQYLMFPRTGQDKEMQAIIYPDDEGLFVPQKDQFWQQQLTNSDLKMSMPFWGHYCDSSVVTYILHDDLNSILQFKSFKDKLYVQVSHQFKRFNDNIPPFEVSIVVSDKSPIAPAIEYKKYLSEKNILKTLQEKSADNPEVKKLYGAMHVYLWGNGRTVELLDKLQELGIKNLWLGYDQDPRSHKYLITPEMIQKAVSMGYLIGPYDSFHTMEDPKKTGSPNTIFDDLYSSACIMNKDGKINVGFAGKGCHISSAALKAQHPKNSTIYKRINNFLKTGINSYFLDCDATGELFDDYSPTHPMTKAQDRANRIERMDYISSDKKLVLGSETAAWWAIPYISFAHGNLSVHNSIHWMFTKKGYGRWWPQDRPEIFFRSINAPEDYIKAKYNPQYRIPLFQTVFHQSIITTDRWEISHMKLANAVITRELLEILYGVPSIWALDLKDINQYAVHIKKLYQFFAPIHQVIASEELKDFKWLDDDRQIQQTIFGNKVKLTANFSDKIYKSIQPHSIEVEWLQDNKKEYYIPTDRDWKKP